MRKFKYFVDTYTTVIEITVIAIVKNRKLIFKAFFVILLLKHEVIVYCIWQIIFVTFLSHLDPSASVS